VTDFAVNTVNTGPPLYQWAPVGNVKDIRVDLPAGLNVNPQAVPYCGILEFTTGTCAADTVLGTNYLVLYGNLNPTGSEASPYPDASIDFPLPTTAYNLNPLEDSSYGVPFASSSLTGFYAPGIGPTGLQVGEVAWDTDYHDYFLIPEVSDSPYQLVESRLVTNGRAGSGYLTLPSACSPTGALVTTIGVESYLGATGGAASPTTTPVTGCASVPSSPTLSVTPATTQQGAPDGATVDLQDPQDASPSDTDSSTLQSTTVTLPQGMTLDPSAANGLTACASGQLGIGTQSPVACPASSQVGTVTMEAPGLPAGSLTGAAYLGESSPGPITGPPYQLFLDVEAPAYNVSIRLAGTVTPDPATGQLTATFTGLPDQQFSDLSIHLTTGAGAPLANPVACGEAQSGGSALPFSGNPATALASSFTVDLDGMGGACPSPPSFALSQGASSSPTQAGAATDLTFSLGRSDGQEYLSNVDTTLPPGLLGTITGVPLCGAAQAASGTCPASSQIGTMTVKAGSGPDPAVFTGTVSLTGPYDGAPYGLSFAVPSAVGPFDFGTIVTQATVSVDPHTAQVSVDGPLPTIIEGVPLRIQSLVINVSRAGFMHNPTSCGALSESSTLTSSLGATDMLSSPFQATGCAGLAFTPTLSASAQAAGNVKEGGVSLQVSITQPPGQANLASTHVVLPVQLPTRLSTLQKACPQATFAASPASCPAGSHVGGASVTTPLLPDPMVGPAYFVSHAGEAFPDLDLVLSGNGIQVILVGNTFIKGGITSSTFASIPDVPVSSFSLGLSAGPDSLLSANGSLCAKQLYLPTTLTAQDGAVIQRETPLVVRNCKVRIVSARLNRFAKRPRLVIVAAISSAGTVSASGKGLRPVRRAIGGANATIHLIPRLSPDGLKILARGGKITVRVGFVPKQAGYQASTAYATIRLKR
jgi:hypothetical protein